MPNYLTPAQEIKWAKAAQKKGLRNLVAKQIANYSLNKEIGVSKHVGDRIKRVTTSRARTSSVESDGSYRTTAVTTENEEIVINQHKQASVTMTEKERALINDKYVVDQGKEIGISLAEDKDAFVIDTLVAGAYLGNTTAYDLTGSVNFKKIAIDAIKAFKKEKVLRKGDKIAWVSDAEIDAGVEDYLLNVSNNKGQANIETSKNTDVFMRPFAGTNMMTSNSCPFEYTVVGDQAVIANGQTIVHDGVTLTFVTALTTSPATIPGEILVEASSAASLANAKMLMEDPFGEASTFDATKATPFAEPTRIITGGVYKNEGNRFQNITCTIASSNMTVRQLGGSVDVSSTLASSNGLKDFLLYTPINIKGAIDVVSGFMPRTEQKTDTKLSTNIVTHELYGVKLFSDGAIRTYNAKFKTAADAINA